MNSQDVEIVIRTARGSEDSAAIAGLAELIWNEHYNPIIGAAQVAYMLSNFQSTEKILDDMTNCGYTYYMAEFCGELAGYCAAKSVNSDKSLFLSKLYVAKALRGRGVARRFLGLLEHRCKEEGLENISLTVNKHGSSLFRVG